MASSGDSGHRPLLELMGGSTSERWVLSLAGVALLMDALFLIFVALIQGGRTSWGVFGLFSLSWGLVPVALHLLWTAALAIFVTRSWSRSEHAPGVILLLLWMGVLGPLGTLIGFVAALAAWALPVSGSEELGASLGSVRDGRDPEASGSMEPEPLADILRHGTLAQRREAVALIGSTFRPAFAEALQMALNDEHNAIRVQAGLVMQQLEDEFDQRQAELESRVDDDLARHGFGADDAWLRLAQMHDEQAFTGLLDEARVGRAQTEALRAYGHHLRAHPEDLAVISAVARLLNRAGQHRLVADWLRQQLALGRVSASILMWYAEALYRIGRYRELRAVAAEYGQTLLERLPEEGSLRAALLLWRAESSRALDEEEGDAPGGFEEGGRDEA